MKLSKKSLASPKKNWDRHRALLAIFCLAGAGWLFVHYRKTQKKISFYQQEIKNLKKQQQALIKTRAANSHLEKSIKSLKMTLHSPGKKFAVHDTKHASPHMITFARKAQNFGLCLNSCVVQKRKSKKWFVKENILYELAGTRQQIQQFITEFRNNKYAFRCKNLAIKKATDQTNINLSCTLQFLIFKTPKNTST